MIPEKSVSHALIFFILLTFGMMFAACGNVRKQRLQMEITKANRELPKEVEGLGRLDSMTLEDDGQFVAYHYTVLQDNPQFDVDKINANKDLVKRKMLNTALAGGTTALDLFRKNQVGMRYRFVEENTGKMALLTIPLQEVEQALQRPVSPFEAAEQALHDDLVFSRQSLPMVIDDNLKVVDFILDDDNLIYVIDVDERVYPLGGDFNMEEAKQGILEELDGNNPGMESTLSHLKKTNRGLMYRYVGNRSKTKVEVELSARELKTYFPTI